LAFWEGFTRTHEKGEDAEAILTGQQSLCLERLCWHAKRAEWILNQGLDRRRVE
jgi:hypothetical protein